MATEGEYVPDSDDEMGDSSEDEINVVLTPQEWKSKAGDLYKVCLCWRVDVSAVLFEHPLLVSCKYGWRYLDL